MNPSERGPPWLLSLPDRRFCARFPIASGLHILQIFRGVLGCFMASKTAADAPHEEGATLLVRSSKQRVGSSSLSGRAYLFSPARPPLLASFFDSLPSNCNTLSSCPIPAEPHRSWSRGNRSACPRIGTLYPDSGSRYRKFLRVVVFDCGCSQQGNGSPVVFRIFSSNTRGCVGEWVGSDGPGNGCGSIPELEWLRTMVRTAANGKQSSGFVRILFRVT